ncbi:MAG: hypothetical protein H6718_21105 [Polyangiaceae bacterium]|nr:hypothetical protein [Myxococcales bacterium]MCB9587917.1 hypothetical protein [Polyangiaceae bacterium]
MGRGYALLSLGLLGVLLGCKLLDRDQPTGSAHFPRCEVRRTEAIDLNTETPIGSATDSLAPYVGERGCSWTWIDENPRASGPAEAGDVSARISLEFTSNEAFFFENHVIDQDPGSPRNCPSHIETGLNLRIVTDDGIVDHEVALNASVYEDRISTDPEVDLSLLGIEVTWASDWDPGSDNLVILFHDDGSTKGWLWEVGTQPNGAWDIVGLATWTCPAP